MSILKEAIESLKTAMDSASDKRIDHYNSIDPNQAYKWIIQDMFHNVSETLILLSQFDVKPSEFTKEMREKKFTFINNRLSLWEKIQEISKDLIQACDLLDIETAEIAELKVKLEKANSLQSPQSHHP